MPKRSNDFQKLVYYINSQLSLDGAIVTESKMVWDPVSEQEREVDIVIEDSSGPYPTTVGIEVTKTKRKADVTKIEMYAAKHRGLNIDVSVIVSQNGFTEPAKRAAKRYGIRLLEFHSALNMEWPEWLVGVRSFSLAYYAVEFTDVKANLCYPVTHGFEFSERIFVKAPFLYERLALVEFLNKYFKQPPNSYREYGVATKYQHWQFSPPLELVDHDGLSTLCDYFLVTYKEVLEGYPLDMSYGEYGGNPIAYGLAQKSGELKNVALTAAPTGELTESGRPKISLSVFVDTKDTK